MSEWREREVGALWKSDSGKHYTGHMIVDGNRVEVVAFVNKDKKSENAPDVNVYKQKPKEEQSTAPAQDDTTPEGM
jgi:hypothetical protein|tara:strand:- start:74 stop:301 length:228 start_codon:yes stop_codon:yes gene_type:complete